MALTITLPEKYGYVVLVALGVIPFVSWVQGSIVTSLRGKAGIKYPNHMATDQQAKESQEAHKFNCAQRAHGNLLENMPQTMAFLLFGGLEYPRAAAAMGAGWVAFRSLYMYGYVFGGQPHGRGRMLGSPFWLLQAGLWGLCVNTALKML